MIQTARVGVAMALGGTLVLVGLLIVINPSVVHEPIRLMTGVLGSGSFLRGVGLVLASGGLGVQIAAGLACLRADDESRV